MEKSKEYLPSEPIEGEKIGTEATKYLSRVEKKAEATIYEYQDIQSDTEAFSEQGRKVIEKHFAGQRLTAEERSLCDSERNKWWYEKYGFPYSNKVARFETLRRKYALPEEIAEDKNLQRRVFEAVKSKDQTKEQDLVALYKENYPDYLEGMTALLELPSFLETQDNYTKQKFSGWREKAKVKEELTQYQFLLSHFVEYNSDDQEFLKNFWNTMNSKTPSKHNEIMRALRWSVVSQVAAMKILKALGESPKLSHPAEDAFTSVDLWTKEKKIAIQVKGDWRPEASLIDVDTIDFPAVRVDKNGRTSYYQGQGPRSLAGTLKIKIEQYKEFTGQDIKAYLMVIPSRSIDKITGKPSDDIIEFFREKLNA